MAQTSSQSKAPSKDQVPGSKSDSPPPISIIFLVYTALGMALSFGFGRDPGTLPHADDFAKELAPTTVVICLFLVSYSLIDVMEVGAAKGEHGINPKSKTFGPLTTNPPEEVYLALRAQANQVEQLPAFLVGSICFSILVNGKAGAVLSAIWATLRRMYATAYRASAGKTFQQSGIANYTIPAYFVLNSMLMGTVIHCVRSML
eukprot:CAMPEP_0185728028 /NCGR_PEP_ID=MMETSP1171-20130828/3530_1 /TAXON_ID=374046 /ORGANISM="Helicotheca tamensis, Strain CCMP826" /LENGTH=202 /DNA_ID=CAMNT_0028396689 /DNA_START=33 /DNA_END=641 /DNA_ORIENTATION=-